LHCRTSIKEKIYASFSTNIVGNYSAPSQTGNIGTTTIYTPPSAGLFRGSVSIVKNSGTGSATGTLGWTDGSGARSYGATDFFFDAIMEVNNQAITINVSVSGTVNYDVYVVIEQLV
jgi:hypothetical protein